MKKIYRILFGGLQILSNTHSLCTRVHPVVVVHYVQGYHRTPNSTTLDNYIHKEITTL